MVLFIWMSSWAAMALRRDSSARECVDSVSSLRVTSICFFMSEMTSTLEGSCSCFLLFSLSSRSILIFIDSIFRTSSVLLTSRTLVLLAWVSATLSACFLAALS